MALTGQPAEAKWIWDSGAKRHYTVRKHNGIRPIPAKSRPTIGTAGAGTLRGEATGDILAADGGQLDLLACMYVPQLTHNLVSTGVMCDSTGLEFLHTSDGVYALPACGVYIGDCLKVADRGPHMATCTWLILTASNSLALGPAPQRLGPSLPMTPPCLFGLPLSSTRR